MTLDEAIEGSQWIETIHSRKDEAAAVSGSGRRFLFFTSQGKPRRIEIVQSRIKPGYWPTEPAIRTAQNDGADDIEAVRFVSRSFNPQEQTAWN